MMTVKLELNEALSAYLHLFSSAIAEATRERQVEACLTNLLDLLALPHQDVLNGTDRSLTPDIQCDSFFCSANRATVASSF